MHVEGGRRFAARHCRRDAIEPRHQRFQLRLHLKEDLGAWRGEKRGVARELVRVAKSLRGVEQVGLAVKWKFAEPQAPAAALLRRHAGTAPAPFIIVK